MKKITLVLFVLLYSGILLAEKDILIPEVGEDTNMGVVENLRSESGIPVMFEVGCYGSNNRHNHNPISPNSTMTSTIKVGGKSYKLKWPSGLTRGVSGTIDKMSKIYNESLVTFCGANPRFCKSRQPPAGCTDFNTCTQQVFDDSGSNAVTAFIEHSRNFKKSKFGGEDSEKFDAKMAEFYQNLFNSSRLNQSVRWGSLHGDFFKHFSKLCQKGTKEEQNQCIGDHGCEAVCLLGANVDSCVTSCRTQIVASGVDDVCTLDGAPTLSCENLIIADIPVVGAKVGSVSISHHQYVGPDGDAKREFYAYNGATTGRDSVNLLYSGGAVTGISIKSEFPGQDGYCGGYHSPLMLFFNKKFPKFTAKTSFLDDKHIRKTYWPEEKHHGYFLARLESLKKDDYKITKSSQLFGNNGAYADGFAILKNYDDDQNGYIGVGEDGKADSVFKFLVLWKDKNGDGKSSPDEIFSLNSLGVTKIYTDYDSTFHMDFAKRAKARGSSKFDYINKQGKVKTGTVLDIFFSEIYY